jgi:hypothetical protein
MFCKKIKPARTIIFDHFTCGSRHHRPRVVVSKLDAPPFDHFTCGSSHYSIYHWLLFDDWLLQNNEEE